MDLLPRSIPVALPSLSDVHSLGNSYRLAQEVNEGLPSGIVFSMDLSPPSKLPMFARLITVFDAAETVEELTFDQLEWRHALELADRGNNVHEALRITTSMLVRLRDSETLLLAAAEVLAEGSREGKIGQHKLRHLNPFQSSTAFCLEIAVYWTFSWT